MSRAGLAYRLQALTDRLRGLDYLDVVEVEEAGLDPKLAKRSSPTSPWFLRAVLPELGDVTGRAVLDIGCGKGQAMRVLRSAPFRRVDGLELGPGLVRTARANLRGSAARRSEVFEADACTFDRYGDYDVLYMFNPFPGPVMEQVAAAVQEQRRGPLTVIYNTPSAEAELLANLDVTRVSDHPSAGTNRIVVYRRA